jgi:hypothetical protein
MLWEVKVDQQFRGQVEDLLKTSRLANKIDKGRAELFEQLVKSPAWEAYVEILSSRIQMFADMVLAPAGSADNAIGLEFVKGAMSGLIIARDLPSVIVMAMKPAVPATDGEDE